MESVTSQISRRLAADEPVSDPAFSQIALVN
jgi:hypothetical protein